MGGCPRKAAGGCEPSAPRRIPDHSTEEARMSKRGRKRKDRRKNKANHGKRPNA